ncbi:MAG: hypothetical protein M3R69_16680 [Acidobacteriota bacterium]|nr:hypothetical protein [Acidobacteriota bacterium]
MSVTLRDEWCRIVGHKAEEAAEPCARPQSPLTIFKQLLDGFIRQTITFGVVPDVAVSAAAIETTE